MTATILDGKATAARVKATLAERVTVLRQAGVMPGLGTVLVGDDPGSHSYVGGKHKDCAEVGIASIRVDMPATSTQAEVEAEVARLNADPAVTGYIVQLPLPKGLDANAVLEQMDPAKDADGLHPMNLGRLVIGIDAPLPCTPRGIVELLRADDVDDLEVTAKGLLARHRWHEWRRVAGCAGLGDLTHGLRVEFRVGGVLGVLRDGGGRVRERR